MSEEMDEARRDSWEKLSRTDGETKSEKEKMFNALNTNPRHRDRSDFYIIGDFIELSGVLRGFFCESIFDPTLVGWIKLFFIIRDTHIPVMPVVYV